MCLVCECGRASETSGAPKSSCSCLCKRVELSSAPHTTHSPTHTLCLPLALTPSFALAFLFALITHLFSHALPKSIFCLPPSVFFFYLLKLHPPILFPFPLHTLPTLPLLLPLRTLFLAIHPPSSRRITRLLSNFLLSSSILDASTTFYSILTRIDSIA